jgi:hypothetical protein
MTCPSWRSPAPANRRRRPLVDVRVLLRAELAAEARRWTVARGFAAVVEALRRGARR